MTTFRFRALITLGPAAHDSHGHEYRSGTHALMVRASSLTRPARWKYFQAVIERDDGPSLHHDDHEVVTITLTGDGNAEFFAPGQHFTLWNGHDIGTGVVSRQVFTHGSPS
jgi:hypothetical protein